MKLSIVIPAYNEGERIAHTLNSIESYMETQPYDHEIIVVVNGSNDATWQIVQSLEGNLIKNAQALYLPQPGKGNAVKRGILEKATGDIIMFMDADNATPITEIAKFLPFFGQGYEVVVGSRELDPSLVKVKQTFKRQVLGHLSHWLIRFVLLPGIYDTQLGFKAFTNRAAKTIFSQVTVLGWGFDMEVLAIARALGFRVKEVAVLWSEYGGGHVPLKAFAQSFVDLFIIKLRVLSRKYHSLSN